MSGVLVAGKKTCHFFAPVAITKAGLLGALVSSAVVLTVGDNIGHSFHGQWPLPNGNGCF